MTASYNDDFSFSGTTLNATEWSVSQSGNGGSYTVSSDRLNVTVNGGSNGYMGQGDGIVFTPTHTITSEDDTFQLSFTEIYREATPSNESVISLTLYSEDNDWLFIQCGGYNDHYPVAGGSYSPVASHYVRVLDQIGSSYSNRRYLVNDSLDLNQLYSLDFRIRKDDAGVWHAGYKLQSDSSWDEAAIPGFTLNDPSRSKIEVAIGSTGNQPNPRATFSISDFSIGEETPPHENTLADETFDGAGGRKSVSNALLTSPVDIDLNLTESQETIGGGLDTFTGIDDLIGTDFNDILIGNGQDNTLEGGAGGDLLRGNPGNDTLMGGDGDDTLSGGSGDDQIRGDSGKDQLFGGTGNDTLIGGSWADTLSGGAGQDTLTGGTGADQFKFTRRGEGADTITDFSASQGDKLVFVSANFGRLASGPLSSTRFRTSSTGNASTSSQRFLFNSTTGVLKYDPDGTGSSAALTVATLSNTRSLSYNQFLIASN